MSVCMWLVLASFLVGPASLLMSSRSLSWSLQLFLYSSHILACLPAGPLQLPAWGHHLPSLPLRLHGVFSVLHPDAPAPLLPPRSCPVYLGWGQGRGGPGPKEAARGWAQGLLHIYICMKSPGPTAGGAGLLGAGKRPPQPEPRSIKTARRAGWPRTAEERSLRRGTPIPGCPPTARPRPTLAAEPPVPWRSPLACWRSPEPVTHPVSQLLGHLGFRGDPLPHLSLLSAPRFFLRLARALQPSVFASLFWFAFKEESGD